MMRLVTARSGNAIGGYLGYAECAVGLGNGPWNDCADPDRSVSEFGCPTE